MQAGQCARCRGELGVAERVCQHCRLDEQFVGWEVRIYSLQTHAMVAGQAVTAEEAIIRVGTTTKINFHDKMPVGLTWAFQLLSCLRDLVVTCLAFVLHSWHVC